MKGKRLVSFVATSAMLMSMAAPALAVTADALGRLQGLGVVTGYTAGGSDFKPDQTITRAEFAAVAVRLLGLEDAAAAAKGTTKFKDVSASHWASGYINLAVGNGVIKGYPNGTFKPEGQVTYAEAFAMLVRVLGYEPQVTGSWPTNYVGKASQIGLMDGLSTTDFNAAALRGNIFTAADNALDIDIMEQTVFGTDPEWSVTDKTLLEDKLDYVKAKDVTITNIPITTTSLDSNEVTLDGEYDGKAIDGNYEVVGAFDATANLGLKGTAWINTTDDKIILFQSDDKVEQDQIKTKNAGTGAVELKVKDDTYNVTADTKVYVNYKLTANSAPTNTVADKVNALADGEMVNVVLDGDDIQAIYAFSLATDIVDRVDTSNDKIYVTEGGGTLTLADNYTIVKDGKTIALSDVKAGDVVQWAKDGSDTYYVRVSSNTASGKVSAVTSTTTYGTDETYKVTVGGTQYTTAIDAQYSTDDGDTYDPVGSIDDLSDVDGQDVTAYLDSFGKVAFIKAGDETEGTTDTVLLKEFTYSTGADGNNYYARVMKADGTETYYKVDDDTTLDNDDLRDSANATTNGGKNLYTWSKETTNAAGLTVTDTDEDTDGSTDDPGFSAAAMTDYTKADLKPGMLVKVDLNADGTVVDNFDTYTANTEVKTGAASKSDDNNTITVAGKTLQVQSDTKFFTVENYDTDQGGTPAIKDADYITWADVKSSYSETNFDGYPVTAVFDGAKAQYVFVNSSASVTSDTLVGILDTKGISGSDKVLNMVLPDGSKTVDYNWNSSMATDVLYTFELDTANEASNVNVAVAREVYEGVRTARTYEVKDISDGIDNTKIITLSIWDKASDTVGTAEYDVIVKDSQTTYFDVTDDPIKVDGVSKGDHVTIYDLLDKDGNYDFNSDGLNPNGLKETDGIVDYVVIDN